MGGIAEMALSLFLVYLLQSYYLGKCLHHMHHISVGQNLGRNLKHATGTMLAVGLPLQI